jgi:phosphatidylglycerol:prolipoprotein diacylglycerol transferase
MINIPALNPVAVSLGPIKIYWYGIAYLVGFAAVWCLAQYRAKSRAFILTKDQITDLIFYGALGAVVGGRIGYVLFYHLPVFLANPLWLFAVWQGGMSFHGGFIGVAVAIYLCARSLGQPLLKLTDFLVPFVPIGLGLGRLANFINGELWGRPTDVPWGMVFPRADHLVRHPSQLYEFFLEGVVLFAILWIYSNKPRSLGKVSGLFLIFYGLFRLLAEWFRAPDEQLGFIAFGWLTMGQLLSIPMIILGIVLFSLKQKSVNNT